MTLYLSPGCITPVDPSLDVLHPANLYPVRVEAYDDGGSVYSWSPYVRLTPSIEPEPLFPSKATAKWSVDIVTLSMRFPVTG